MKIQSEFNIAAILSKISVADISSNPDSEEEPRFATLFEAALQDVDDPEVATTLATLHKSGTIMPDLPGENISSQPGSPALGDKGNDLEKLVLPEFRTVQLFNGRPVITSPVEDADLQQFLSTTDFFSGAAARQTLTDEQNMLTVTATLPATEKSPLLRSSLFNDIMPTKSAADAMFLRDHPYPASSDNPKPADMGVRADMLATLSAKPDTALQQSLKSATITPILPTGVTAEKNGLRLQQQALKVLGEGDKDEPSSVRSSILRDTEAQIIRDTQAAPNLALVTPRAALMTNPGTMSTASELSGLSNSAPAPASGAAATLPTESYQQTSRVTERWMHIDDLGKQFNTMIKRTFLDNNGNGLSNLRIMLYPENMGSIQAEIIDKNQTITVNLVVQNEEVARLLRDNSQALRDALGNNALVELNIQKEKTSNDGQMPQGNSGSDGSAQASAADGADESAEQANSGGVVPASPNALDTYV